LGLLKQINKDLEHFGGKGTVNNILTILFSIPFRLMINYRIGHYLSKRRNVLFNLLILYLKKRQLSRFSCDISYDAIIGNSISFPHPTGIVIGLGVIIEDNVRIWQNVTLGSKGNKEKEYPHIKNNVKIYCSAQILGNVTVGEGSIVGACSLVLEDIPDNAIAIGIPAKTKKIN